MIPAFADLERLRQFRSRLALSDDSSALSYEGLAEAVTAQIQQWKTQCHAQRPLILLSLGNTVSGAIQYLACVAAKFPVILIHNKADKDIIDSYQQTFTPNLQVNEHQTVLLHHNELHLDEQLALLLSTSGTTGSGKCVALSYRNLQANTESIINYLPILPSDTTLATLPFSYSYGLSVLNSHLARGATVAITQYTAMQREFWERVKDLQVASLAGVPHWYEMLLRLRFTRMELPALRYFTQAGGKLSEAQAVQLGEYANSSGKRFYVMYGQTEATARMSYLAPEKLLRKPASVGQPIPGGRFILKRDKDEVLETPFEQGELYYQGDNVMLGYVRHINELAHLQSPEILATGDLGYFDDEGDYYISGRIKRIIKLFGERVNLDSLEERFAQFGVPVACCGQDNLLGVVCQPDKQQEAEQLAAKIVTCPPLARQVIALDSLPLLLNGKVDYARLNSLLESGQERK